MTGNTEAVAGEIKSALGGKVDADPLEIADVGADLGGKPCAVFGVGDSAGYSDYFCDTMEEIHRTFSSAGCKMVGAVATDGYTFDGSKSVVDGKFVGCPFDEDNESDQTPARAKAWAAQ